MTKFTPKQNKEFWEEFAKKSKDNIFGASGGRHLVEIENAFIFSQLKSRKFKNLLDIGCGNGQRTLLFSKFIDKKILGIDYSENMINEAKKLLLKKPKSIQKKSTFRNMDIKEFTQEETFDVIISCRCLINQPSHYKQVEALKILHKLLKKNGSLILAEISLEGMKNLNLLRQKYGLSTMNPRWHNLHLKEKYIFPKIQDLFKIQNIQRAGTFYFISRIINPALIFPKEPLPETKINDIALKLELIHMKNNAKNFPTNENFGAHLLVHLVKK